MEVQLIGKINLITSSSSSHLVMKKMRNLLRKRSLREDPGEDLESSSLNLKQKKRKSQRRKRNLMSLVRRKGNGTISAMSVRKEVILCVVKDAHMLLTHYV